MAWVSLDNLTRFYTKLKEKMYLKTEVDTKLNGKAASSHTHTIANITNLQNTLNGKAASSHTHDDRYYTESEINTKISELNSNISNAGKFYGIDTSNLIATVKQYTKGIGITEYTYNAIQNCYIFIMHAVSNSGNNKDIKIQINGQDFVNETAASKMFQERHPWVFPVKAGDEVYFSVYTNNSGVPLYFKVFGVR